MKKAMLLIAGMLSVLALSPSPARAEAQGFDWKLWRASTAQAKRRLASAPHEARKKKMLALPTLHGNLGSEIIRFDADGRVRPLTSFDQLSKVSEGLEKALSRLRDPRG